MGKYNGRLERKRMLKLFPENKSNPIKYDATTLTRSEALDLISTIHRSCAGTADYYRKANSFLRVTEKIRRQPEWEAYEEELLERQLIQEDIMRSLKNSD